MSEPLLNVMKIMLLAGLYLFFVRVLWSVYNELRDPRTRAKGRQEPMPAVDVAPTARRGAASLGGPNTPGVPAGAVGPIAGAVSGGVAVVEPAQSGAPQIGQLIVIEPRPMAGLTWALGNEITIGRAATCGIHIDDTYVSSVHARIFNRAGAFVVEDLASRNGTVLNGALVTSATELRPGDRLQFGTTALEFS